ncbi:MAG: efflux RND transporter permease subunit [Proteobacteria bacterium]|nr:efflux RND transporter permease subunit [Pseudomonadota bacterium]
MSRSGGLSLSDFSVDRPVTISMLVMIVLVIGGLSLSKIGLDLMPDVDFPTVSVITRYDGASSAEIEKQVTKVVEGAAASVNGVTKIKSISQEDTSILMIEFEWGTNLDFASQDLREAIGLIAPMLPDNADEPMVVKFSLSAFPMLGYSVTGMSDTVALNEYLSENVAARIERLDGVAQVVQMGGEDAELHVNVDRQALAASGITIDQVLMALRAQNMDLPGGRVIEGGTEYLVRTLGQFGSLRDVEESVVGMSRNGTLVRVRDVATVVMGVEDIRNTSRAQGLPSVFFMINKQSGANPLKTARKVKAELGQIRSELPGDVEFRLLMDTGDQIETMANNVSRSGLIGGFFAIVFMFLFLRSIRPTFAIAVAVPLSMLVTFIPIYLVGETLNLMTMGGLMLGIGMLVDNAIVVIEAIFRHLEMGKNRKQAARDGAREVGMAITASTFTTIAVFLPLFFGGGLAGELVRGLALVVAFALGASLLVALTIVPMLASVLFNEREARRLASESVRFKAFRTRYARVLRWALGRRKTTIAVSLLLFVSSLGVVPLLGAEFMPGADQPIIVGKITFPVGTPLAETERAVRRIETFMTTLADVETANVGIGAEEDDLGAGVSEMSPAGPHEAQLFIRLKDHRTMNQTQILQALRAGAPQVEGMTVEFMDMGQAMTGGSPKPVQIDIYGKDLPALKDTAQRVIATVGDVEGLTDLTSSVAEAKPERHLVIHRDRANSYGLTVAEIASAVETASLGAVAGIFRDRGDEFFIRVRYAEEDRSGFDDLDRIMIPTRTGVTVPLRHVAAFETSTGQVQITRNDQQRRATVSGSLAGRDLASVVKDTKTALGPLQAALPSGYRIEFGGQFEDMAKAFLSLLMALALSVLLVYMVMASQFEAFVHPLVIMASVPMALVGVVGASALTASPISVATLVGLIMLAGIVVNNGIVLVDAINQRRREGFEKREAIVEGGLMRVRAVLITSGTTIMALMPMAIWPGRGAELTGAMATVVAGGLAASSVMTLVLVPVVYEWFDSVGAWGAVRLSSAVHGAEDEQEAVQAAS